MQPIYITGGGVTTNNDDNDDNSVNDDSSSNVSNDGSDGDASGSENKSHTSANKTEDNENAHWMSYLAMANENIENNINSDIIDSSPDEWMDLQSNYDLDAEGVYNNDDSVSAFVCLAYTGGSKNEKRNDGDFQEHSDVFG